MAIMNIPRPGSEFAERTHRQVALAACPPVPACRSAQCRGLMFIATTLLLTISLVGTVAACSVPVFRYALEKWASDPYEIVVFHKGGLPPDQQAIIDRLRDEKNPAGRRFANVRVRQVNLETDPPADLASLWKEQKNAALPWMVLRYPLTHPIPSPWAGPFSSEAVDLLLDSPARKEISQRILRGQTGVWLFLESGDKSRDEAAYGILKAGVAKAQLTLKLPEIKEEDLREGLVTVDPTELRVEFSILRVSRNDPAEKMLVQMLLGSEEDLRDGNEPMAFPAFGRGRVLYALVGAGISDETVAEGCKTLVGECTCQVKEQNPGMDLVMAVDWANLVRPKFEREKPLPPLVGVASLMKQGEEKTDRADGNTAVAKPSEGASRSRNTEIANTPSVSVTSASPASGTVISDLESRKDGTLLRNAIVAAGAIALAVCGASLFLLRKKA